MENYDAFFLVGKVNSQWEYYESNKAGLTPIMVVEALTVMADRLFESLPPGQRDIVPTALMEIRALLREKAREEPERIH